MAYNPILGTTGNDYVLGTDENDLFNGRSGEDDLFGGKGDDVYFCGSGGDTAMDFVGVSLMSGDAGNDFLAAGDSADTLLGGAGDDLLSGGRGENILRGGTGADTISSSGDALTDSSIVWAGSGRDHVSFGGLAGGTAYGGSGVDTIEIDWTHAASPAADISLYLHGSHRGAANGLGAITFSGFERVAAFTGAGNDTVTGGALRDVISLGTGDNTAKGFAGNDLLIFTAGGVNVMDGGDGIDSVFATSHGAAWHLFVTDLSATDNFGDTFTNIEHWKITGAQGADTVSLGNRGDFFSGRGGNDTSLGQGGEDYLYGGKGDDMLFGGTGDDHLSGGEGADILTGGKGADHFTFTKAGDLGDQITDFTSGQDQIEIAARLLGKALPVGAVAMSALHLDSASGTEAQFVLRADTGGGGGADLVFDNNGTDDFGETVIARFAANIVLEFGDLLII